MKKMFLLLVIFLAACSPSAQAVQTAIIQTQSVWTTVPSQTPNPTYTPWIIFQTKIIIATATFTATSQFTPTSAGTSTPTPNAAKTSTSEALAYIRQDINDGFYLVNVSIAPGVWKSNGFGDGCYWEITKDNGDIINNFFGMAGGTMYVPANAFQVQVKHCGTWKFLK